MRILNQDLVRAIHGAQSVAFVPNAQFDASMDCIRIELRDCSWFERDVNVHLTMCYANHSPSSELVPVGLIIGGVQLLFKKWKLPITGRYLVADILKRLKQEFVFAEGVRAAIEMIADVAMRSEMVVHLQWG